MCLCLQFLLNSHPTISRRAIPPKYFENIFKTNDSVGVTRQQTWLRNEKIGEYFGENLDILTYLIWIFNKSNWFQNIFSKYLGGITLLSYSAGVLISKMLFRVVGFYSKFPLICVLLIKKNRWFIQVCQPQKTYFSFYKVFFEKWPKLLGKNDWNWYMSSIAVRFYKNCSEN